MIFGRQKRGRSKKDYKSVLRSGFTVPLYENYNPELGIC